MISCVLYNTCDTVLSIQAREGQDREKIVHKVEYEEEGGDEPNIWEKGGRWETAARATPR